MSTQNRMAMFLACPIWIAVTFGKPFWTSSKCQPVIFCWSQIFYHLFKPFPMGLAWILYELRQYTNVKLGIWTKMLGPKSCKVLASTCGLRHSLYGCLEFRRSGQSRRVWSQAKKKLKKGESKLRRSRLLSWYLNWQNTYNKLEYLYRDKT